MKKITLFSIFFFSIIGILYSHQINLDSLVTISNSLPNDSNKVDVLNELIKKYICSDTDKAKEYSDLALKLSNELSYQKGIAETYSNIGKLHNYLGKYSLSLEYTNKALIIGEKLKDIPLIVTLYNRIGHSYRMFGSYRKSLEYFFQGLNISNKYNYRETLPALYTNIGIAYELQKNYDESQKYFNLALDVSQELNNEESLIYVYNCLSGIHDKNLEYDISLDYLYKAYKIGKELNNQYTIGFISRQIGDVLILQKKYKNAYKYYEESLHILESLNYIEEVGKTYISLSTYYYFVKKFDVSSFYAKKAIEIGDDLHSIELKNDAALQLGKTLEKQKKYKEALNYFKIYKAMQDSLMSKENIQTITQQAMQLDFDKQQKELKINRHIELKKSKILRNYFIIGFILAFFITFFMFFSYLIKRKSHKLLLLKNAEINKQNTRIETQMNELRKLNATKDKFFSIISHDLKSPFNALLGFSELINQNYERFSKEKLKDFNEHIYAAAKSLFNLVDNLMHWSKSKTDQISIIKENIDMHEISSEILKLLKLSSEGKDISVVSRIEKNTIILGDRNLLSFILRNLVANAIKFTYAGGHVIIDSSEKEDFIEFSVRDNGVGITDENLSKLFRDDTHLTTRGTIDEKGTGLGLLLCKEFVSKLNGKIWVESQVDKGSTFFFSIPKV